jgi:N-acyl homoserine lactone hydrolase
MKAPRTAWLILLAALAGACESPELRVPYIPPKLENWPQPYHGVGGLKLHAFTTGFVSAPEVSILAGGSWTRRDRLPVTAFVIEHPSQGLVLVGTGLSPSETHDVEEPDWNPLRPQYQVAPGSDLASQMRAAGLEPSAVRWIILPSWHPEQTGMIKKFPAARVVLAKAEHEAAEELRGTARAQLDAVLDWKLIDFTAATPLATFPAHVDLFGDRSVLLLDVRGATPGTMAVLLRLSDRPLILTGDLLILYEQLRHVAKPAAAADMKQWWDRAWRLKRFKELVPELVVVPAHDLQPLEEAKSRRIIVHTAPEIDAPPLATPTPSTLERLIPRPL